jgi:hypothetical protein
MNENEIDQSNLPEEPETEIVVNDYGLTKDSAVVIEEKDRTVLLTDKETIIIDKEPRIDVVPKNRPRKVYGGMWGQNEIAAAAVSMLAILAVIAFYLLVVGPSNRELERNRAERSRLELELISARAKYGSITSTETQVAKLMTSVDDFESNYLPVAATGRTSLYQRINGLIAGYGLIPTNGPDFSPLEIAEQTRIDQSDEERGREKFRSLFPGVYVTMTVEGSYQNLRRFIREIETGNEFVVVSSVELEPSDSEKPADPTKPPPQNIPQRSGVSINSGVPGFDNQPNPVQNAAQTPRQRGKTHGETVSLRLEMAAYFRRQVMAPVVAQ